MIVVEIKPSQLRVIVLMALRHLAAASSLIFGYRLRPGAVCRRGAGWSLVRVIASRRWPAVALGWDDADPLPRRDGCAVMAVASRRCWSSVVAGSATARRAEVLAGVRISSATGLAAPAGLSPAARPARPWRGRRQGGAAEPRRLSSVGAERCRGPGQGLGVVPAGGGGRDFRLR